MRPRKLNEPKPVLVRLESDEHARLALLAAARGESLNDLIRKALAEWFEEQPEAADVARLRRRAKKKRG